MGRGAAEMAAGDAVIPKHHRIDTGLIREIR
jgi:hypothetical protein